MRNTAPLTLEFRFTPADGTAPRAIHVSIETQESERAPLRVAIVWGDGHPDGIPFPGPPLSGARRPVRGAAKSATASRLGAAERSNPRSTALFHTLVASQKG